MKPGELYSCDSGVLHFANAYTKRWNKAHMTQDDLLLCIAVKHFNDTSHYTFLSSFHGVVTIQMLKGRGVVGLSRVD